MINNIIPTVRRICAALLLVGFLGSIWPQVFPSSSLRFTAAIDEAVPVNWGRMFLNILCWATTFDSGSCQTERLVAYDSKEVFLCTLSNNRSSCLVPELLMIPALSSAILTIIMLVTFSYFGLAKSTLIRGLKVQSKRDFSFFVMTFAVLAGGIFHVGSDVQVPNSYVSIDACLSTPQSCDLSLTTNVGLLAVSVSAAIYLFFLFTDFGSRDLTPS